MELMEREAGRGGRTSAHLLGCEIAGACGMHAERLVQLGCMYAVATLQL